jgi:hypothetical protein
MKTPFLAERAINKLKQAVWSPNASLNIELLSGTPFWDDERFDEFLMACTDESSDRIHDLNLWRCYLVTGEKSPLADYDRCEETWNDVLLRCPSWPGFRSERCTPDIANQINVMIDDANACL